MTKKKIFGIIGGAVAIVAVAGVAINNANSAPKMTDLMIKNLEILTQGENGGSLPDCCPNRSTCTGEYCGTFVQTNGNTYSFYYYR